MDYFSFNSNTKNQNKSTATTKVWTAYWTTKSETTAKRSATSLKIKNNNTKNIKEESRNNSNSNMKMSQNTVIWTKETSIRTPWPSVWIVQPHYCFKNNSYIVTDLLESKTKTRKPCKWYTRIQNNLCLSKYRTPTNSVHEHWTTSCSVGHYVLIKPLHVCISCFWIIHLKLLIEN